MVDFVKKKIVEKLARFTKHLNPNDISLSFLKGKGELNNLDLNADFITDVLRLPPWIRVKSVFCDQIKIDVPFTDLNKSPIRCMLHTVIIEVSTCGDQNEDRERNVIDLKKLSSSSPSSYGLTEKIVDGMKVEIGCIRVQFSNPVFAATLEMNEVVIESTTPEWKPDILPHCRYKNADEGSVIIYKRCTWSNFRVEGGKSIGEGQGKVMDPIRLMANATEIRVALKRRVSDCKILCTRVSINLGDLSWVLTQEHLKSISLLVQSLTEAAMKWNQDERKKLALLRGSRESLDSNESAGSLASTASTASKEEESKPTTKRSKSPAKDTKNLKRETAVRNRELNYQMGQVNLPAYEVIQDSIHIKSGAVNLQLCDGSGSLLLYVKDLLIDLYLDQLATTGRCHWNKSNIKLNESTDWSGKLVKTAEKVQYMDLPSINLYKLRERGVVVRCSDFKIKSEDEDLLPVISCDNKTFSLPDDIDNPAFQFVITMYYYPLEEGHRFLVPRPNVYGYLAPIHANVHQQLFLWLAEFTHGVVKTVNLGLLISASSEGKMFMEEMKAKREVVQQLPGIDVKFYTPYTKITLPSAYAYSDERPRAVQVETGGISLQNHSLLSILSNPEFLAAWSKCRSGWLSNTIDQFPSNVTDSPSTPNILVDLIEKEIKSHKSTTTENHKSSGGGVHRSSSLAQLEVPGNRGGIRGSSGGRHSTPDVSHHKISLHQLNLLTIESWYCHTRCVSLSFVSDLTHQATLYSSEFVSDFPLQLWIFQPQKMAEIINPVHSPTVPTGSPLSSKTEPLPTVHILLDIAQEVEVKLKRLDFLFLMRLKDSFQGFKNKLMQYLTLDSLIEAQGTEAFHINKESNSDDDIDHASEAEGLKEKLSAAFKDIKKERGSVSSNEGESDGGNSLVTAVVNCNGVSVNISLPSLGPVLKSPKQPSPVLSNSHSRISSQDSSSVQANAPMTPPPPPLGSVGTTPPPPDSSTNTTLPAKQTSTPNLPVFIDKQPDSKTLSMPQLNNTSGDSKYLENGTTSKRGVTTSPTLLSSSELGSDEFVLVSKTTTVSSSSLSQSTSPSPMELIPEGDETTDTTTISSQVLPTTDSTGKANGIIPTVLHDSVTTSSSSTLRIPSINKPQASLTSSLPLSSGALLVPQHSLFVKTGQLKVLLSLSDKGIALRTTVDSIHIDELTQDEIAEMERKRTSKDKYATPVENVASPVIKGRVELGKNVREYFEDGVEEFDIDGVAFLKVSGLKVVLGIKNLMAVKDFFDDEKESNTPLPIQLRIVETQLVIKDQLSFPLVHPKNATVNIPDIFVNRGPRAHGTNLVIQTDHNGHSSDNSEQAPPTTHEHQPVVQTVTNGDFSHHTEANQLLLESFHSFVEAFQTHVSRKVPISQPEKASHLLEELGKTLSLSASYTDTTSCDFYSNVSSSSVTTHQTVDSLKAEVEALKADGKRLQLELVGTQEEYTEALKEKDDVTRELIDVKMKLANTHLVMEEQIIKMERLYSENCNLKDRLGE